MKILFVKPDLPKCVIGGSEYSLSEPLEFEYLAATVPHHDVKLFDMRFGGDLRSKLSEYNPDAVCTTAMTINVYEARRILKKAKQFNPKILTMVGGYHPTVVPEDFNLNYIDIVVMGQAYFIFNKIIDNVEAGKSLEGIPALAFPSEGGLKYIKPKITYLDGLDELPLLDRNLTREYRKKYYVEYWQPAAMMRTSFGCLDRCTFCAIWKLTRGKFLTRSVDRIIEELDSINEKYLYLIDDNTIPIGQHERIENLIDAIKANGINKEYYTAMRTDSIVTYPHIIEKWAKVGLKRIFIGMEAHTDEKLNDYNKRTTHEINRKAVDIMHQNGIRVTASFLVDHNYTKDDFNRLFDYANQFNTDGIAYLILTPHPNADIWYRYQDQIKIFNYDLYDHFHTVFDTRMPTDQFYREYSKLWMKSYTPLTIAWLKRISKIFYHAPWAQVFLIGRVLTNIFGRFAENFKTKSLDMEDEFCYLENNRMTEAVVEEN